MLCKCLQLTLTRTRTPNYWIYASCRTSHTTRDRGFDDPHRKKHYPSMDESRPYHEVRMLPCCTFRLLTIPLGYSVASDTKLDERMNGSNTSLPEAVKPGYDADVVEKVDQTLVGDIPVGCTEYSSSFQVNEYIATSVLPDLRRLLVDNDKVLTACTSIAYNIINPSLKGKTRCVTCL